MIRKTTYERLLREREGTFYYHTSTIMGLVKWDVGGWNTLMQYPENDETVNAEMKDRYFYEMIGALLMYQYAWRRDRERLGE